VNPEEILKLSDLIASLKNLFRLLALDRDDAYRFTIIFVGVFIH
jgi:hypothetical protein